MNFLFVHEVATPWKASCNEKGNVIKLTIIKMTFFCNIFILSIIYQYLKSFQQQHFLPSLTKLTRKRKMPRANEKYISIMEDIKFQLVLSRAVVIR